MIDLDNQTDTIVDAALFDPICDFLGIDMLELILVEDAAMQAINAQTRGKNSTTDVLSFPLVRSHMHEPLGSVIISVERAYEVAHELGHTVQEELQLLFTHGALHVLGFDHETDHGQMRDKEVQVITHFNLPKSLIVRNTDV